MELSLCWADICLAWTTGLILNYYNFTPSCYVNAYTSWFPQNPAEDIAMLSSVYFE